MKDNWLYTEIGDKYTRTIGEYDLLIEEIEHDFFHYCVKYKGDIIHAAWQDDYINRMFIHCLDGIAKAIKKHRIKISK